jgi:ribosomal protein L19
MKNNLAKSLAKGQTAQSNFWIRKMVKAAGIETVIAGRSNQLQTLSPASVPAQ